MRSERPAVQTDQPLQLPRQGVDFCHEPSSTYLVWLEGWDGDARAAELDSAVGSQSAKFTPLHPSTLREE